MKTKRLLKIIAVVAIVASAIMSLVGHQRHSFSPQTLNSANAQTITTAYIRDCKTNQIYPLNKNELIEILSSVNKLEETSSASFRGEAWIYFHNVELTIDSEPLYRIVLQTRESLKGEILASFERTVGNATYFYGDYKGNNLNDLIKSIIATRIQDPIK